MSENKLIHLNNPDECTTCHKPIGSKEPVLIIDAAIGYESKYDGDRLRMQFCSEHADGFLESMKDLYGPTVIVEAAD